MEVAQDDELTQVAFFTKCRSLTPSLLLTTVSLNFWDSPAHRESSGLRPASKPSRVCPPALGWVPEWSNGLAWKACVPHKGTEGSNPSPSARFPKDFHLFEIGVPKRMP